MHKIRLGLIVTLFTYVLAGHAYAQPGWGECSQCHGIPVVTNFELPASHDSLTVPVTGFSATDADPNNRTSVDGYMLTTSATAPSSGDAGWQSSPPTQYTFSTDGLQTLYAWAKDSFGSVSAAVSDVVDIVIPVLNTPPVADAGPDQSTTEGSLVTLDGTNSNDTDDGIKAFFWEQTGGSVMVALSDAYAEKPTFDAPVVGPDGVALTFTLTITDWTGATDSDTCIVNITNVNINPVADAGPDQTVAEGVTVLLDGSGSNGVDDGIAQYLWEQINITGAVVTLSDAAIVNPQFVLDSVGPDGESVTLQLTVTDDGGLQATDTVVINVTNVNQAPIADAGIDQTVMAGNEVILDASGSNDPDGALGNGSYTWKQTAGTAVTLSDPGAVNPVFTAPAIAAGTTEILTFELTVTDGLLQSTDTCSVQVTAESVPPVEEPPVVEPPVDEPPVVEEPPAEDDIDHDSDSDSYEDDDENDEADEDIQDADEDDEDIDEDGANHNKRARKNHGFRKRFWQMIFSRFYRN